MSYMPVTAESLSQQLGQPVPDLVLLIAKNAAMELESRDIAKVLGVPEADVTEVMESDIYQSVRLLIGAELARGRVDIEEGWEALERIALNSSIKYAQSSRDPEYLLKVATVANRAQRRIAPKPSGVLDPASVTGRVALTLTSRIVEKLNRSGEMQREQTRTLSLTDGSAANPTFEEVTGLLGLDSQMVNPEMRMQPARVRPDDAILDNLLKENRRG